MFWKLSAVIVAVALTSAALLGLRQQRYDAANKMVQTTRRIDQSRRNLKEAQAALASRVTWHNLTDSIAVAQLRLEPIVTLCAAPQPRPQQSPQPRQQAPTVLVSAHRRGHRAN